MGEVEGEEAQGEGERMKLLMDVLIPFFKITLNHRRVACCERVLPKV